MSLVTEDGVWRIDEPQEAVIASLPPLIFGNLYGSVGNAR